jgi:hypothetical protein
MEPSADPFDTADSSITWVVNHHVRMDRADQFEEWLRGITEEVKRFPGWRGGTVLRPSVSSGPSSDYVVVVRFDSSEDLRRWENSTERAHWLHLLQPFVTGLPTTRSASGLETWFQLSGETALVPPPKWKMAVLVLVAIFPLVVLVTLVLGAIAGGRPYVGVAVTLGADYLARTLLTAVTLVILMTWFAMPWLSHLARRWLYPTL